jgi:carboxypeptidase D
MIYIDQPISTGYSTGNISVNDEHDVTTQFMGFWANFIDLFSMQGYDIYITGESYAGQYIPYIASGFLDAKDEINFNLKGILLIDPYINDGDTLQQGRFLFIYSNYFG